MMDEGRGLIISIDPSINHCGLAAIDTNGKYIRSEVIKPPERLSGPEKLPFIQSETERFIRRVLFTFIPRIEKVIYEDPYVGRNSNAAKILSQVAGVVCTKICEITGVGAVPVPSVSAICKLGLKRDATKSQIRKRIKEILGKELNQDEADACMVALSGIDKQLKLFKENKNE